MKRLTRKFLEHYGINLSKDSHSLGLTPYREFVELLRMLRPKFNGWDLIRVGGEFDGGYLVPNDFEGIEYCFSPGSDLLWKFENDLAVNYGIRSFICDREDKKPQDLTPLQDFSAGWLGPATRGKDFISLGDWMQKKLSAGDKILQMDIEGSEYLCLLSMSDKDLLSFRIMAIEFHFLESFKNRWAYENIYKPLFERLLENFTIVHTHANNCCGNFSYRSVKFPRVLEVTFHRNDRLRAELLSAVQPNTLDSRNVPGLPELEIDWKMIERELGS